MHTHERPAVLDVVRSRTVRLRDIQALNQAHLDPESWDKL
jgi:hypothetical protein